MGLELIAIEINTEKAGLRSGLNSWTVGWGQGQIPCLSRDLKNLPQENWNAALERAVLPLSIPFFGSVKT